MTVLTRIPRSWLIAVVLLSALSVGALLAELYSIMPMSTFVPLVTLPALVLIGWLGAGSRNLELRKRIRIGAIGGLLGTVGYDIVRIPFALAGQRIFAPILSYGLLIDGGGMSSGWTDLLGWLFHVSNGVTFGIGYAVVFARRHWAWGVAYGLLLETAAYASPFTEVYRLTGKTAVVAIAYLAHVAYGWPLGRVVQRMDSVEAGLRIPRPATTLLAVSALTLVLWHAPWIATDIEQEATDLSVDAGIPVAVVVHDRFTPEWLRVESRGCVLLVSRSDLSFREPGGELPAGAKAQWCFDDPGVHRVPLGNAPYSGGFVYEWDR